MIKASTRTLLPPHLGGGETCSPSTSARTRLSPTSRCRCPLACRGLCSARTGAGKSTLVKCIMGTYRADSGIVKIADSSLELKNPKQAHALGIGMVYQHFTLVENMSVVENIVMVLAGICRPSSTGSTGDRAASRLHGHDAVPRRADRRRPRHLGRREAEGRDPQADLPSAKSHHPRRADLGADAAGSRRGVEHAAEDVLRRRSQHPHDHAQVPRGDGVLRRGDGAASRQTGRRRKSRRAVSERDGSHDDGRSRHSPRTGRPRLPCRRRPRKHPKLVLKELFADNEIGVPTLRAGCRSR